MLKSEHLPEQCFEVSELCSIFAHRITNDIANIINFSKWNK